jgi:sialidase-1
MQSMCHLLVSALLLSSTLLSSTAPASEPPPLVDVFVGGQDGYPAYRIPSLVTTKRGTLLAFAEARATLRDHAENDIVLKRSTDQGRTWVPLQLND